MAHDKLAEAMFLLLHDPFSGRAELAPELVRCGLVAGEFAELMIGERIAFDNDRIVVIGGGGGFVQDEISALVVEAIQSQTRTHGVRSWIDALGDTIYEQVSSRLVDSRTVSNDEAGRRSLRRGPQRFPAANLLNASGPRVLLEHMLGFPQELDLERASLAAILGGLSAFQGFDPAIDRAALRITIGDLTVRLPPDLRDLVRGVEAYVAANSLTVRR